MTLDRHIVSAFCFLLAVMSLLWWWRARRALRSHDLTVTPTFQSDLARYDLLSAVTFATILTVWFTFMGAGIILMGYF